VRLVDVFSQQKKMEISTPYDPVHLTHVGFNSDTGEFTGLPKEWQQLLQESGISKQDQAANPQAVIDIVAFYQDATTHTGDSDAVWKKFEDAKGSQVDASTVVSSPGMSGTLPPSGVYEKPVSSHPMRFEKDMRTGAEFRYASLYTPSASCAFTPRFR
jgi:p21-activated kinase 1